MENFFGIGSGSSNYDKRRHINVIFMEIVSYHFYADPGYADRLVRVLKTDNNIYSRSSTICNSFLTYNEHNYLNLLRERYNISDLDFTTILSGIGVMDNVTKSPAGYGQRENTALLVQMVVAIESMTSNFGSQAVTEITKMIGSMGLGMKGISFDQAKFNRLFDLTFKAMEIYGNNYALPKIEQYVIDRW